MKAIVYKKYGAPDVLKLEDVEKPTPGDNEILIKVKATAVNSGDWRLRKADPFAVRLVFGLLKPKINILGSVFAGEVEMVGKDVIHYKAGDKVFGSSVVKFGTYADYICLPADGTVVLKPADLSYTEAAAIPFGGMTALYWIKKARIKYGQKILVYGASGSVGTAAIQIAKHFGANVTAVCSTMNIDMVKSLGADKVIDYTREDFMQNGLQYHVIFDTVNKIPISRAVKSLAENGTLISSAADMKAMLSGMLTSIASRKKVLFGIIKQTTTNLLFLKGLIDAGKLKPVIDRTYPLEQIAQAHTYVEQGHKKGNVAIELESQSSPLFERSKSDK